MSDWSLVFYETAGGRRPVQDYLDGLDAEEAAKVRFDLDKHRFAPFGRLSGEDGKMNYDDYIAEKEARDPAFREACERLRPQFEFRKALIGARLAAGLTQRQLAQRMGTTQSAIARLESGSQMPTLDTLYRLATVLEVDFTIGPQEPITARPHKAA